MVFKPPEKATALFIVLMSIFFSSGCGKIGDPVPPQQIKAQTSREINKPNFNGKAADSNKGCEEGDSCGKKTIPGDKGLFY